MSIIELFTNYLFSQKPLPSKVTIKNYISDIKKFLSWFEETSGNNFHASDVNVQNILKYKDASLNKFSASSVERQFSALRKFFQYLKSTQQIDSNPFDEISLANQQTDDIWHLKSFRNYLYILDSSSLTIKNYIIDVKQFMLWASETKKKNINKNFENIFTILEPSFIEDYKNKLFEEKIYSLSSINRKVSSLRKYFVWLSEKGYIALQSSNIKSDNNIPKLDLKKILNSENKSLVSEKKEKIETKANQGYSKFPPLRLIQKIIKLTSLLIEIIFVNSVVKAIQLFTISFWKLHGKSIFSKKNIAFTNSKHTIFDKFTTFPKTLYENARVSIASQPLYKTLWFHIKYTRPLWFKRYQKTSLAYYFNFIILFILCTTIAVAFYNAFIQKSTKSLATTNGVAPPRILSFQGRLTDASDNPITAATDLRFAIYNSSNATGTAQLWQEADYHISPDSDGIFSVILGNSSSISNTVFTQNSTLYLGVTVGLTSELTPRQQLATVAFASNAESVQGLYPITDLTNVTGNTNTVLALNGSGVLDVLGSSNTTFQSLQGKFTLTGNVLNLNTAAGSGTNIQLAPDGQGLIDLQKPLKNSTLNNNIRSSGGASTAAGAVEADSLFAVLATSSGQSAVTIDQEGGGPIISASASGVAKFTVDNSGNVTANSFNVGLGTTYFINNGTSNLNALTLAGNLTLSANVSSNIIPNATDTYNLGTPSTEWNNLYIKNIYSPVTGGVSGFWQLASNVIAPSNTINDLAIGGNGTSSALFQVFGATGNATSSGNLTFNSLGSIQTTLNQNLTIGGSTTGNITLSPLNGTGTISLNGNATIASGKLFQILGGSGNPTATNGIVWYDTTANKFKIVENGTVKIVCNTTDAGCGAGAAGTNFWTIPANSGSISPINNTLDLVYGSSTNASSSAKFAVLNMSSGTPVASVSAGTPGGAYLTADGKLATTAKQSLNLGDSATTGNVVINPSGNIQFFSSSNTITSSGNLTLAGTISLPNNNTLTGVSSFTQFNNGISVGGATTYNISTGTSNLNSLTLNGTLAVNQGGSNATKTSIDATGNILPGTSGGANIGSVSLPWNSLFVNNIYSPVTGGVSGFWQLASNVIAPSNTINDLAIGGNGTSSALFQVFGATGNATSSGNLTFNSLGSIQTTKNQTLTIGGTTTGNIILQPLNGTGNVGIGTISPLATLDIRANQYTTTVASISGATGKATLQIDQSGVGDLFTASQSGGTRFTIGNNGNITDPNYAVAGGVLYSTSTGLFQATVAGTSAQCLIGGATPTWAMCASGASGTNYWQLNSKVLSPYNTTLDLAVGGTGSSSATPFQVFAGANGSIAAGTASESGSLGFFGSGNAHNVNILDNGSLNFQTSVGGDATVNTALYIGAGTRTTAGNIGIGTTTPTSPLTIASTITSGTWETSNAPSGVTLTGLLTGHLIDLSTNITATNQSATGLQVKLPGAVALTNTSSTVNYKGLTIAAGGSLTQTTGGTTTFTGSDITTPNTTQTAGTLNANGTNIILGNITTGGIQTGANITLGSVTTAGTQNGISITPPSTTNTGAIDNGINIGTITSSSGTDNAIEIGSGWTNAMNINSGALAFNSNSITSTGAITMTAAASSTWSTSTGNLTIESGSNGILNLQAGGTTSDKAQIKFLDSGGNVRARLDMNSPYGTGADGAITLSSSKNINTTAIEAGRPTCLNSTACADGIAYRVIAATAGATLVNRFNPSDTISNGIAAGDEVLLIDLQGTTNANDTSDVGNYQFLRVASVTASSITFTAGIGPNMSGATQSTQKVVVQRVPNYTNVTINSSGILTASAYDGLQTTPANGAGYLTGIVAFRSTGTVSVANAANTNINVNSLGYRGGAGGAAGANGGVSGESYNSQDVVSGSGVGSGGSGVTGPTGGFGGGKSGNGTNGQAADGGTEDGGGGGGGSNGSSGTADAGSGGGAGGAYVNGGGGGGGGGEGTGTGAAGGTSASNVGGGGGGGASANATGGAGGNGGSGGSNASAGGNGGGANATAGNNSSGGGGGNNTTTGSGAGAGGGGAYGTVNLSTMFYGSGGGGGGGQNGAVTGAGGGGGAGGGIIFISADTINLNNSIATNPISANGAGGSAGSSNGSGGGAGGGGAGGSIFIQSRLLQNIGSGGITSTSGTGATKVGKAGGGGGASLGRIALASSGTDLAPLSTNPAFNNNGPLNDEGILHVRAVDNAGADIAENYTTADSTIEAGDVVRIQDSQVTLDSGKQIIPKGILVKANHPYDSKVLGIISTDPGVLLGNTDLSATNSATDRMLALAGRVPLKVSTENGPIMIGDYLTTSTTAGVAMKATKAGVVIAKALESYDNKDPHAISKITAFVSNSFYDPQVTLTDTGDVNLVINSSPSNVNLQPSIAYSLQDIAGNIIDRVGEYSQLAVGKIKVGLLQSESVTTNSLTVTTENITIGGKNLHDYILSIITDIQNSQIGNQKIISPIANVYQIHTNIISPLGENRSIAIKIDTNKISIVKDASTAAVATIDNNGNASFSGTLQSNGLAVNTDATISGTLHAGKIVADEIVGLSEKVSTLAAQNITNITNIFVATPSGTQELPSTTSGLIVNSNNSSRLPYLYENYENISSYSAFLSYVPHLKASTAEFDQGLMSFGPTSLSDTTITGQLSIGSQFILSDNSINVLGADLQLQPLKQGGIAIAGGQIRIDNDGNLIVNGKSVFNGTLAAKIISPIAENDLLIKLGEKTDGTSQSQFKIQNASSSAIFAINQLGDIISSGAATISKLNLNIVAPAQAVSENEIIATSSAGTTSIHPNQHELTIDSSEVTENSLIYITPVGTLSATAQTPFLLRQIPHQSFTVGISEPQDSETKFNWLIIN